MVHRWLCILLILIPTLLCAQGRPIVSGESCGAGMQGTFPNCSPPVCVSLGTTKTTATGYEIGTTNTNELYGGTIYVTAAATITIPLLANLQPCVRFAVVTVGAVAVSVDPNASDRLILDGTALSNGDKATNQSTAGDTLVCIYESADGFSCASSSTTGNLWTDTN